MSAAGNSVNLHGHHHIQQQQPNSLHHQQSLNNNNNSNNLNLNTTSHLQLSNSASTLLNGNQQQHTSSSVAQPSAQQQIHQQTTTAVVPPPLPTGVQLPSHTATSQPPASGTLSQTKIMNAVASAVACPPAATKKIRRKSDNKVRASEIGSMYKYSLSTSNLHSIFPP